MMNETIKELKETIARMENDLNTITHNKNFMDAAAYDFLYNDTKFWLARYKQELNELTAYRTLSMSKGRLENVQAYWKQWKDMCGLTSRKMFFNQKGGK